MSADVSTTGIIHSHNVLLLISLWGLEVWLWIFILASHNVVAAAAWACSYRSIVYVTSRSIYVSWYRVSCRCRCTTRWPIHCAIKSMRIILCQVQATTDFSTHPTHARDTRCSSHTSTAAVNIVLCWTKVKVALIPLSICHLIRCEILMLIIICLILRRWWKLVFVVLSYLLRYLLGVLAATTHGASGFIIVLLGHFDTISLVLYRSYVVSDAAYAIAELAKIQFL